MRSQAIISGIFALSTTAYAGNVSRDSTPGVDLANHGSSEQTFYFCENVSNGDGTADPGFTDGTSGCSKLVTSVAVQPSATTAVALDPTFKGRIARSTDTPATWVEVQIKAPDGMAWGDISLEIGCDGAAEVGPAEGGGTSATVGFSSPEDIVAAAPDGATETRADGVKVISVPWSMGAVVNQAAAEYLEGAVPGGNKMAYITGTSGTDCATSSNNRLAVSFY